MLNIDLEDLFAIEEIFPDSERTAAYRQEGMHKRWMKMKHWWFTRIQTE